MTEQLPKDLVVKAEDTISLSDYVIVHKHYLAKLQQDLARYENAHKVLVAENDRLRERVDDLIGQLAEKVVTEQADGDRNG